MDKISEMLTKIRNAQMAGHAEVNVDHSKLKLALALILEREGFVEAVHSDKNPEAREIRIVLKYHRENNTKKIPAISGLKKVSHLGQRIYIKNKDIKNVKNKYGVAIISTSKGIMTGEESKKLGLGGEYICEVW